MDNQLKDLNTKFSPSSTVDKFAPATEQLIGDLKKTVADTQILLTEVGNYTADKLASARPSIEGKLKYAQEKLKSARDAIEERTKDAADNTHEYVLSNPWKSLGLAAAGAAFIGLLLTRRH